MTLETRLSRFVFRILAAGFFLLAMPLAGQAQEFKEGEVKTYDDWTVFTKRENGARLCYMVSIPKSARGNYTRRGDTFLTVTHRPDENSFNVVSIAAGYPYKKGSETKLTFDGKKTYTLFTENENAWAESPTLDKELAAAMRKGLTLVVKGTSSRGTLTTDTYSLRGFTAAHNMINYACGAPDS